jgi:RND family efflux transporter MFP subunit
MIFGRGSAKAFIALGGCLLILAGCEEPVEDRAERVRAIKPYYVIESAGGEIRRYSGSVVASDTSALSFAVSGTVKAVGVNRGDRVSKGQALATLDPGLFELNVQAARSELRAAKADLDNTQVDLERKKKLFERGWVAKASYDQAIATFEAASGTLNLLRSRLGLAERDLANTKLRAPFDGVISARDVDPFSEISVGQKVLQIDSDGGLEVEVSIPDTTVGRLAAGASVTIDARNLSACGCPGRVTEIGATSSAANAVTVKAAILSGGAGLLPGMAVDVSLVLGRQGGEDGLLVPLVAIAPGDASAKGYVFKFDETSGTVNRVPVKGGGGIRGNLVGVTEGVEPGDIIAAAGVSLLRDGQRVSVAGQ